MHTFRKRVRLFCATESRYVVLKRCVHLAEPRVNFHLEHGQLFSMLFTSWCIFVSSKAAFCIFAGNQGVDNEV